MVTKTFISIDWDYCVPNHVLNDWGFNETQLHLTLIWNARKCMIPIDGEIKYHDLDQMEARTDDIPQYSAKDMAVGESHAYAYHYLKSFVEEGDEIHLINFDLHHDIWNSSTSQLLAENWLYKLICDTKCKWHVSHIIPEWSNEYGYGERGEAFKEEEYVADLKKKAPNLISWEIKTDAPEYNIVDALFLCRSGCWTPPTLDEEFSNFVYELAFHLNDALSVFGSNVSNPLKKRPYVPFNPNMEGKLIRQ